MPIPQKTPFLERLRAWLTWADVDEACELKPLVKYKRFFRWLGV